MRTVIRQLLLPNCFWRCIVLLLHWLLRSLTCIPCQWSPDKHLSFSRRWQFWSKHLQRKASNGSFHTAARTVRNHFFDNLVHCGQFMLAVGAKQHKRTTKSMVCHIKPLLSLINGSVACWQPARYLDLILSARNGYYALEWIHSYRKGPIRPIVDSHRYEWRFFCTRTRVLRQVFLSRLQVNKI